MERKYREKFIRLRFPQRNFLYFFQYPGKVDVQSFSMKQGILKAM